MQSIPTVNRQAGRWWTFLQFPVTRIVLAALVVALCVAVPQTVGKLLGLHPHTLPWALVGLTIAVAVLTGYSTYVRVIEKRTVVELALRGAPARFGLGLLLGASLFYLTMLALWLLGTASFTGTHALGDMFYPLVGALVAACLEETLIRGVLFRVLEESLGSWVALALSAALFGLLHAFNPGANVVSTLAIALEAGVLLAAAYMYTRSLWFVIGLHLAWNFTEGGIFAASVSGGKAEGFLGVQFSGGDILSGGKFGPEASIAAVLICLAAGLTFILLARRETLVVPPFWRRV